jgi:transglutaminase-like putative cysteine protease
MLISLLHRTTFSYAAKAQDSFNEVRLRPVDDAVQTCRSFELRTDPGSEAREYQDFYGNTVNYFDIAAGHAKLVVEALSEVETVPNAARPAVPEVAFETLESSGERDLHAEFLAASHYVPLDVALWKEAQDALASGRHDVWGDVRSICRHIYKTFTYKPRSTGVGTTALDAVKLRAGVCQDFAHIALGMCRSVGIPARYVSGYFMRAKGLADGEGDEASHAWIEALVPGFGWAPFDPTHDRMADDHYVKVASGRDYGDIRPISGTYRGGKTRSLLVEVRVREAEAAGAR